MSLQHAHDYLRLLPGRHTWQTNQQDPIRYEALPKDKFTEVLVSGQEHSLAVPSPLQDFIIPETWVLIRDRPNLVSSGAHRENDRMIDVLVGDPPHAALSPVG